MKKNATALGNIQMLKQYPIFCEDGTEYMKLCSDITAYCIGDFLYHREGITDFYKKSLKKIIDNITFYETSEMDMPAAINEEALTLLDGWLSFDEDGETVFSLKMESGSSPGEPSDIAFHFVAAPFKGMRIISVRLILPMAKLHEHPTDFAYLAIDLLNKLKFHSGHSGYSLNWDHRGEFSGTARRKMGMIATRYPSLDLPHSIVTLMCIPYGIKRVNWLTMVGRELMAKLGGKEALFENIVDSNCTFFELPDGLIIRASDRPCLGDRNRDEDLAGYHSVGHLLASVRSKKHPPFLGSSNFEIDDERSENWLGYFDQ